MVWEGIEESILGIRGGSGNDIPTQYLPHAIAGGLVVKINEVIYQVNKLTNSEK